MPDWLSYAGPPFLVLVLLAATLFALGRINKRHTSLDGSNFKIKRLHSFGPRQQIVVVEYQEECYLLGVTQYTITSIAKVEKRPLDETPLDEEIVE